MPAKQHRKKVQKKSEKPATRKKTRKASTPARKVKKQSSSSGTIGGRHNQEQDVSGSGNEAMVGIRVRMYRVGFGDFFLVTLKGSDVPLHILIDCGVHAVDLGSIGDAIADMYTVTGGKLALVIMTHRHADHISGFAKGADTFAEITVEKVWMSWFEDPGNKEAVAFQQTISAVAARLQLALAASSLESDPAQMAANATGTLDPVTGLTSNDAALAVLHGGFKNKASVEYYKAGDACVLPDSLVQAGLGALVLGPPIDEDLVSQLNGKGHQYLTSTGENASSQLVPFRPEFWCSADSLPASAFELIPANDLPKTVHASAPSLDAARAQQVDNTLNNQSLVVLFRFRGKTLLFVGDAQWGNWQNFLFGGAFGTPGHQGITTDAKRILQNIDFYKVGHHGSTNATPIDAVNAFRDGCVAMCSTQPGAYGSVSNKSEVPRAPLMEALEKKTNDQLARSDQVHVAGADSPNVLKKLKGLPPPGGLPRIFEKGPEGELYIDYEM